MWRDLKTCHLGQRRDFPHLAHALRQQRIRLQDVVAAAVDQKLELVQAVVILSAGDRQCVQAVAKATQAVVVMAGERLFEPPHSHLLQLARHRHCERKAPCAMTAMAGLDPCLIGVDHDVDAVSDRGSNGLDDLEVVARVGKVEPKLHRPIAVLHHPSHVFDAALRGAHLGGRTVGRHAV